MKQQTLYKTKILSTGRYVPNKVLTNADLEKMVETSDQWITERTGIKERRIASTEKGEYPSEMAYKASLIALERAKLSPNDIDCILFATCTGDMKLPNTACLLQSKLGITNACAAVDLEAACSGFVYSLNMGNAMIKAGMFKTILVVGSEMLSSQADWKDRNTCILFGDGAGVAIITRNEDPNDPSDILSCVMAADSTGKDFFFQRGGSSMPITQEVLEQRGQFMNMNGREMFKVAVRTLADNAEKALKLAEMGLNDVDWFISHQANTRIIDATAERLNLPKEKNIVNIHKYGNTSAASIPLAFDEALEEGKIKRGDVVLFDTFGAGLTSAATLFRY